MQCVESITFPPSLSPPRTWRHLVPAPLHSQHSRASIEDTAQLRFARVASLSIRLPTPPVTAFALAMDQSDTEGSNSNNNPQVSYDPHEKTSQSRAAAKSSPSPPMEPVPVFLDRTYTIVDTTSDDIVSWSEAGDSFIVRQVRVLFFLVGRPGGISGYP